jgi:hypothetical protein
MMVGWGWMGEASSVITDGCGSLLVGLGGVVIWRHGSGERREVMSGVRLKECCIRVREHDALANVDSIEYNGRQDGKKCMCKVGAGREKSIRV